MNLWDADMYSLKLGGWSQKIVYLTYVLIIFHHWFYTSLNDWPFGCTSPRGVFFVVFLSMTSAPIRCRRLWRYETLGGQGKKQQPDWKRNKYTLPETNIAMENPPFWWYLPGKMGIFMGYVSFREGMENSWKFQSPGEIERWWKGKEIAPKEKSGVVVKICDTQISVRHLEKFAFDISGLLLLRKNQSKKSQHRPLSECEQFFLVAN